MWPLPDKFHTNVTIGTEHKLWQEKWKMENIYSRKQSEDLIVEDLRNRKDFFNYIWTGKTHENIIRTAVFKRTDFKRTLTEKLKDLFVWSLLQKMQWSILHFKGGKISCYTMLRQ